MSTTSSKAPPRQATATLTSAPQPVAKAVAPRRRWVVVLLSAATALWLAAQLAAGLAMKVHTWPVAGFPMFSEKRSVVAERRIEVRTRSGRLLPVGAADFGLTDLQFLNYQRGMLNESGMVKPNAGGRLGRLAAVWNRRHGNDPAVSMTLTQLVRPLPYGTPASSRQVIRWNAP